MILEHKTINLFGKLLFEKAVIQAPHRKPNPMPQEACFLYVLEGATNNISEEESLLVKKDEAVLMKCGSYLSQMVSTAADRRYAAVAVHFYPEVLKKVYGNEVPAFLKENRGFDRNMVRVEASILVQKYIESLLFYFENPQLVSEDILILKLKEIILLLIQTENAPHVLEVLSNLFNPREYSFKEVIDAHIFSTVTVSELADLTHLSLSSFKREFARLYDDSPARYFRRKRLEKAQALLAVSNESIGDIAFECGFSDMAYFSKIFKSHTGFSPSAFRMNQTDKKLDEST